MDPVNIDIPAGLVVGLLGTFVLALVAIGFWAQRLNVGAFLSASGACWVLAGTSAWAAPTIIDKPAGLVSAVAIGLAVLALMVAGMAYLDERAY